jgi:hypothetical protein
MRTRSRTRLWVAGGFVVAALIALLLLLRGCAPEDVTVIAVGDMACSPTDPDYGDGAGVGDACQAKAVSDLALTAGADVFWGLGDYQYELPSAADYEAAYDPTWGRLRSITRPAVGNQELKVNKANTFYDYFGEQAGPREGYYSYDVGAWHVVVLNTNCTTVQGGCGPESPQAAWLREDLQSSGARCVAAYGHHPRWSNGIAGPDPRIETLFSILSDEGVAIYLSGHESDYERFGPLDGEGRPAVGGTAQFVVGTGGQSLYEPGEGDAPWRTAIATVESEFFQAEDHGFLRLELQPDSYSWSFESLGGEIDDAGTRECPQR